MPTAKQWTLTGPLAVLVKRLQETSVQSVTVTDEAVCWRTPFGETLTEQGLEVDRVRVPVSVRGLLEEHLSADDMFLLALGGPVSEHYVEAPAAEDVRAAAVLGVEPGAVGRFIIRVTWDQPQQIHIQKALLSVSGPAGSGKSATIVALVRAYHPAIP